MKPRLAAHSILQNEWQSRVYLHGQRICEQKNDRSSRTGIRKPGGNWISRHEDPKLPRGTEIPLSPRITWHLGLVLKEKTVCVHEHLDRLITWTALLLLLLSRFSRVQTLCDPIDGSPPGSPVPGILQARTWEWVAISFSNAWKWKVKVKSLSRVWLLAPPWTAAY